MLSKQHDFPSGLHQICPIDLAEDRAVHGVPIIKVQGEARSNAQDYLAVEEPLEIRLQYGERNNRVERAISVTMRTPGSDVELVVGFLITEGVVSDSTDIVSSSMPGSTEGTSQNVVLIRLDESVIVNPSTLERNFYTTSSCGICGKASLLALRSVSPPRRTNALTVDASMLFRLPVHLRTAQQKFARTGGIHAAGLFNAEGQLDILREDIGRHNAVDKLIGSAAIADRLPLRNCVLMLSGRASFELLQKAVMAGIPIVASIGAPSSLAVQVAKEFDITLVGFLKDNSFNIYSGGARIRTEEIELLEEAR